MARKAVVDKDTILSLLSAGETTQRIAEKFSVSRQAIDLHRRDFIKRGLLPDQRAIRTRKAPKEATPTKQEIISPREYPPSPNMVTLDEQIDLLINAFNALKRLPQLEKEVETYKREYEDALREIERLKENEKRRLDQESRWLNTQRQGNINSA